MFFFLSTKFLPMIAALLPLYLIAKNLHVWTTFVLGIIYATMNLPIAVWMMRSFLAKLCAASLIVSLPVIIAGFTAQDKLVQGLSMGAVK